MRRDIVFPGSFDPFTVGHEDIVRRALKIFDRVVVAIGVNGEKKTLMSPAKRLDAISRCFADEPRVDVVSYEGLTADLCKKMGVFYILRGIRTNFDWEYEKQMADVNVMLDSRIETIYLQTTPQLGSVSSSVVRDIFRNGGDVSKFLASNSTIDDLLK